MALQVKVGSFTRALTTGVQNVTGLGFQPKVVIFLATHGTAANAWRAGLQSAIGWMARSVGESTAPLTRSMSRAASDGVAPTARFTANNDLRVVNATGVAQAIGSGAFLADGFSVNWTTVDGEAEHIPYIALGGDVLAATGTYAMVGAKKAGDVFAIAHDVPFVPSAALLLAKLDSINSAQSVGAVAASGGQWALGVSDVQDANPSDVRRIFDSTHALNLLRPSTGVPLLRATANLSRAGVSLTPDHGILPLTTELTVGGAAGHAPVKFNNPGQVAVDSTGRIIVADTGNGRLVIQNSDRSFQTQIAGLTGISGVCVDSLDNIIVVYGGNTLRQYTPALAVTNTTTFGAGLKHVATNGTDIYVTSVTNHVVYRRSWGTLAAVATIGSFGSANGQFNTPWGIVVTGAYMWVADSGNNRIQRFTVAGAYVDKIPDFAGNRGMGINVANDIFVANETLGYVVKYSTTGGVNDFFLTPSPVGVAVAPGDVVWVSDTSGELTKWDQVGVVWTKLAPVVKFNTPGQVVAGPDGSIYIVDSVNNRVVKLDPNGTYANQWVRTGITGAWVDSLNTVYTARTVAGSCTLEAITQPGVTAFSMALGAFQSGHISGDATSLFIVDSTHNQILKRVKSTLGAGVPALTPPTAPLIDPGLGPIAVGNGFVYVGATFFNAVEIYNAATMTSVFPSLGPDATPHGITVDDAGRIGITSYSFGPGHLERFNPNGTLYDSTVLTEPEGVAFAGGKYWVSSQAVGAETVSRIGDLPNSTTFHVLYLGGAAIAAGVTNKPTGAAPAAHPIATALKVKAALFGTTSSPTANTVSDNARLAIGASDGTNHRVTAGHIQDNVATANSDTYFGDTRAIIKADNFTASVEASATMAVALNQISLSWSPNDAVATPVAYLAFGDPGPDLQATIPAYSQMHPQRVGTPHALSSTMAQALLVEAVLGDSGNLGPVPMPVVSSFTSRLSLGHPLTSVMAGELTLSSIGYRFFRPLSSEMAASLVMAASKVGSDAPFAPTNIGMVSALSIARGFKFDRPLSSAMRSVLDMYPRFKAQVPIMPRGGPSDLQGTVNWHLNPSVERELTGWFATGAALPLQRVTEQAWDGTASAKLTTTGAGLAEIVARSTGGLFLTGLDEDGDTRRTWAYSQLRGTPGQEWDVFQRVRYEDNSIVTGEKKRITLGSGWDIYHAPGVALDPTKVLDYAEFVAATPVALATTLYADGVQLEEDRGQGPTAFAIGGYGRETGYWVGAPHVSPSARDPVRMITNGVGRGGDIVIDARMYRATYDNLWVEDVSDAVVSAVVTMDPERKSTWSLDATLTLEGYERLLVNQDWLAPVLTVYHADGTVRSGQLGLYFVVPSEMDRGEYKSTVKLSAFDPLWLLDRQGFGTKDGALGTLVVRPGVERIHAVNKILDGAVLTGGDGDGVAKRYSIAQSGKEWKRKHEWAPESTRLEVCNEILESSGFWPLFTTGQGVMVSRKMGPERIIERTPVRAWTAHLPPGQTVSAWIPRISSLKSEVVGTIKTVPHAHDFFDEILLITDDPSGKNIFIRGRVKGPRKDREEERRHHNDRHDNNDKGRNRNKPREERLEDRREARDEKREERREDRRELRDERHDDRRDEQRHVPRDDKRKRHRKDRHNDKRDDDDRKHRDKHDNKRTFGQGKERKHAKRVFVPLVDDDDTAAEIAAALTDSLSSRVEGVALSVLPDPAPNYARETVELNIRDAYGDEVAAGRFLVRSIKWGFTPKDCLQVMQLDYVSEGTSVVEIS